MTIDHAWNENRILGIDYNGVAVLGGGAEIAADGGDFLALDQNIALHEIADRGIHADDGPAL